MPFGGEKKVRRRLVDVINFDDYSKILDMCCGTGGATFALAKKLGNKSEISAIDLSSGQIRVAKRRNRFANIKFRVMDSARTTFDDSSFDLVVIAHALHEMPRHGRMSVLLEAKRVLREGGRLAVFEMDKPQSAFMRIFIAFWWFYWLPFNFETPTRCDMLKYGLEKEIREVGFRDIIKESLYKNSLQVVQARK